jgi:hypothetical protein
MRDHSRDYPRVVTALPGPRGEAIIARDRSRMVVALVHQGVPARRRHRPRRDGRGRRRQPLHRLDGRHRRLLHRLQPPQGRRRRAGGRRQVPPHLRHRLLLRDDGRPVREASRRSLPGRRQEARLPHQLRHRGHRGRRQARAPLDTPPSSTSSAFATPSTAAATPRSASRREQGQVPGPLRPAAPGRLPPPLRRPLPRPLRHQRRRRSVPQSTVASGRGRGRHARADPGRGRLHLPAPRVHHAYCAASATSTAPSSSTTRSSPASAAPASCGPASSTASPPT